MHSVWRSTIELDLVLIRTLIGIMQDDDDELAQEIAAQASIYQNGVVTILAGGADRVSQGFLRRRPNPHPQYNIRAIVPGFGEICFILQHNPVRSYNEITNQADPVNTRAWIFQESKLPMWTTLACLSDA
jgi:hypothetical protein